MNTLLFHTIELNTREHPLSLGLLYLYCPAAAYWWRVGVEITFPPDPVWLAVADYAAQPPRTLREYLEERGLKSLLDDARKYVQQVTAARQRLPHITAPELLPTFPGGKLPLRKRFGIKDALNALGGADGFFAYVRTWAFLLGDWKAKIPFAQVEIRPLWVAVRFEGLRSAYRLPAWGFFSANNGTKGPLVLGVPPGEHPAVLSTLYLLAQSNDQTPWEHSPQVWGLKLDGDAAPVDPLVPPDEAGRALLALAERARQATVPEPLVSLSAPERCFRCPFRHVCFTNERTWTPQARAFIGAQVTEGAGP